MSWDAAEVQVWVNGPDVPEVWVDVSRLCCHLMTCLCPMDIHCLVDVLRLWCPALPPHPYPLGSILM